MCRPRRTAVTRGVDATRTLFEVLACILLCLVTIAVFSVLAAVVVAPQFLSLVLAVGFVLITVAIVAATRVRARVRRSWLEIDDRSTFLLAGRLESGRFGCAQTTVVALRPT